MIIKEKSKILQEPIKVVTNLACMIQKLQINKNNSFGGYKINLICGYGCEFRHRNPFPLDQLHHLTAGGTYHNWLLLSSNPLLTWQSSQDNHPHYCQILSIKRSMSGFLVCLFLLAVTSTQALTYSQYDGKQKLPQREFSHIYIYIYIYIYIK